MLISNLVCVQVTLVATAPLTNLAVAVQLDPSLPKKLKALYIMGGNTDCVFATLLIDWLEYVCVSAAGHDRCASVFTQQGATPLCAGSLTSWLTQRLPTSSWTATPVPPTSPLGSSAAGTACLG